MSVQLIITKAKASDSQKVREISKSYKFRGVELGIQDEAEGCFLIMSFNDKAYESFQWPAALHRDLWPHEEPNPDDEDKLGNNIWDKLFEEKGRDGFLALLQDLAPYLETPLLIVLVNGLPNRSSTSAWSVQPGVKEVQELEVSI
jgi:hypothetical protein